MHFSTIATSALGFCAAGFALAKPTIDTSAEGTVLVTRNSKGELVERQLDQLTGILSKLEDTLNNVNSIVDNAATLLQPDTVSQLKDLISAGDSAVNSPIVQSLGSLLNNNTIGSVTGLISGANSLLSPQNTQAVSDVLATVDSLLTPQFVNETQGLITTVSGVSSSTLVFLSGHFH